MKLQYLSLSSDDRTKLALTNAPAYLRTELQYITRTCFFPLIGLRRGHSYGLLLATLSCRGLGNNDEVIYIMSYEFYPSLMSYVIGGRYDTCYILK